MNWYNDFYKNNVRVSDLLNRDINYFLKLKKIFLMINLKKIKFYKKKLYLILKEISSNS